MVVMLMIYIFSDLAPLHTTLEAERIPVGSFTPGTSMVLYVEIKWFEYAVFLKLPAAPLETEFSPNHHTRMG